MHCWRRGLDWKRSNGAGLLHTTITWDIVLELVSVSLMKQIGQIQIGQRFAMLGRPAFHCEM